MQRWREKHPEKYQASLRRYTGKHPERNLKNNPELQAKCAKARIEAIYRKHSEEHKDDPESLNIRAHVREIVEGEMDDWQFRST